MIDEKVVGSLIRLLDESSLDNLEIEQAGARIRLSKSPSGAGAVSATPASSAHAARGPAGEAGPADAGPQAPDAAGEDAAPAGAPAASSLAEVASPMVGTFYRAPSPEADPYVSVGDAVAAGDVLCVIEAMKLMNELECEVAGRVAEVCARNAEPVEYGQVLFRIDPA